MVIGERCEFIHMGKTYHGVISGRYHTGSYLVTEDGSMTPREVSDPYPEKERPAAPAESSETQAPASSSEEEKEEWEQERKEAEEREEKEKEEEEGDGFVLDF